MQTGRRHGLRDRQGRVHPHQQPRRRGRRRDPGRPLRHEHAEPERAPLRREGRRPRHADRQRADSAHRDAGGAAAGGQVRRFRSDAAGRLGHGDRQPVQPEPYRDRRRRVGARPPVRRRERPSAEHDPDRRRDQPGQLRRAAAERPRRGHRHEHRHLHRPALGQHRDRVRHADQRDSRRSCRSCGRDG